LTRLISTKSFLHHENEPYRGLAPLGERLVLLLMQEHWCRRLDRKWQG
jgi:hypothetical protein